MVFIHFYYDFEFCDIWREAAGGNGRRAEAEGGRKGKAAGKRRRAETEDGRKWKEDGNGRRAEVEGERAAGRKTGA